jgi:hypothetical protein
VIVLKLEFRKSSGGGDQAKKAGRLEEGGERENEPQEDGRQAPAEVTGGAGAGSRLRLGARLRLVPLITAGGGRLRLRLRLRRRGVVVVVLVGVAALGGGGGGQPGWRKVTLFAVPARNLQKDKKGYCIEVTDQRDIEYTVSRGPTIG